MTCDGLHNRELCFVSSELPPDELLFPFTPRSRSRLRVLTIISFLALLFPPIAYYPGPHQEIVRYLTFSENHKPNTLFAVFGTGICFLHVGFVQSSRKRRKWCSSCGAMTTQPHSVSYTYCPACRRLAEPTRVLFSPAGTLDLDNPAYLDGPEGGPRFIAWLFWQSLEDGAGELRLEPDERGLTPTFRLETEYVSVGTLDPVLQKPVCQALKAMAGLDLDRSQQEGSLLIKYDGREVRAQVIVEPTPHGERVIARFPSPGR